MRTLFLLPVFLLPVFLLLASCAPSGTTQTVYELPPFALAGTSAAACIEQCDIERVRCGQDGGSAVGACNASEGAISRGFNGCRPGSPTCTAPPNCLIEAGACTAQYNSCFNSCGGLVRTIRTPYLNPDAMPGTPFVVPPLPGSVPLAAAPARRVRRAPAYAGRDRFTRDENGEERFIPGGQPIRLRAAPEAN